LKSPFATLIGENPRGKSYAEVKVPFPPFNQVVTDLESRFSITMSSFPSPLKSPTSSEGWYSHALVP
jgi:hypothetical protein